MGRYTPPPGSRELRKRRTHEELLRAGLDLFLTRGYAGTTVGEIAEAADVSERTFFRYFAGKEELVLAPLRKASQLLAAEVARRPAGEDPLRALTHAMLTTLRTMAADAPLRYLSVLRLISSEPTARAACLSLAPAEQRRLATVLAAREGTEPGDLRPVVLASAVISTVIEATMSWSEECDGTEQSLLARTRAHLAMLRPAVSGAWDHAQPRTEAL